jgi:Cd2+/Zn2+-exporting ATPase
MTGEPVPRRAAPGTAVLAGYINTDGSLLIRVDKTAGESGAAKIVELVEEAAHAKAKTELFITRFARVYTPLVVAGAALVAFLPPLLVPGAALSDWAHRALVMLVISCPCALVVSVPLGYFGGIGGASRRGILVKGARHLDALAGVRTVVFDKTGTLTRGVFKVMEVKPANGMAAEELLRYAALAEAHSNHPIAASIREAYGRDGDHDCARDYREIGGMGVSAHVSGKSVLLGNDILMHREGIGHGRCDVGGTAVHVAVDRAYAGYLVIGDELKHDAGQAIRELRGLGIDRIVLLTGDSAEVAGATAAALDMDEFHGNLLPADKVAALERVMRERSRRGKTAFVGDGINDAPVLARSDVGIAMGRSGSDAAVETADVVLMTDSPARVAEAVRRARRTRRIVVENIVLAFAVKAGFLALGGAGLAGMWEAVIADMGVTLVAVLNAARAMR